jgi:hypothetical protein
MYWLDVRDAPGTFWAFCRHFAGCAMASFEGSLSRFDLLSIPGANAIGTATLYHHDLNGYPATEFVIVPLTTDSIAGLKHRLHGPHVFGRHGDIRRAEIGDGGGLLFSACDNFHRECVRACDQVPTGLLDTLVASGVIRAYREVPGGARL